MAAVVITDIHSENLYKTGHMANRWFRRLMDHLEEGVTARAPVRSGELKYGIGTYVHRVGEFTLDGELHSSSHHTTYVLRGTGFPIKGREGGIWSRKGFDTGRDIENAYVWLWGVVDPITKQFSRTGKGRRRQYRIRQRGYWMKFGPDEWGPKVIAFEVSGQDANNFLLKGWRDAAHFHRAMAHVPTFILNP